MSETTETRTPVAAALAANRAPFAAVLLAVGVLIGLSGLVALGTKTGLAARLTGGVEKKEGEKDKAKPAEESVDPDKQKAEDAAKVDYAVAGILGLFAGLGLVAVGVWVRNRPPGPLPLADARVAVLAAGGSVGFFLLILGVWLSYSWFQPLVDWLEKGDRREAKWPVLAVAILLAGGAVAFFAAQPARAEERTNPQVRRIVYGFNLGLSAVLLFVALAVVNVFVSLRVPNAIDTTEGGFYTFELSEATKEYLAKLDRPVTAYVTLPRAADDHIARETYRLLDACSAAAPDKFKVRPLATADKEDIDRLVRKFPQSGFLDERGILLVAGADEAEFAFVRESDLAESKSARGSRDVFQGEARLARELLFLAEGKVKAVVYFTAGSGELSITPEDRSGRTALRLKAILEKNNVDVRPLTAGLDETKVPDDATAVVVADPTGTLPPTLVTALTKYMTSPRPNGKLGKLVVIAGPHALANKGVAPTGLEDLLVTFGVRLVPGYLLNERGTYPSFDVAPGVVNGKLLADRNPIALAFGNYQIPFPHSRPLQDISIPDGAFQATPLFVTPAKRFSWVEPDPTPDPAKTIAAFRDNEALQRARDLSPMPRTLAVVVTEGTVGRAVVFGCGDLFDDKLARNLDTLPAELFANTVDWLRDRPAVANIANKTYGLYTPKPDGGSLRGEVIPVGLVLLAVLGLGVGVWVTRRK